jgi:hypothetical protein
MIPNPDDVANQFRLPHHIADGVLVGPSHVAREKLRVLIGNDALTAAEDDNSADNSQTEIIKFAGNYLAMYFAAPSVAARIRSDGQVITESSETARTLRFATPKEMQTWREGLLSDALDALGAIPDLLVVPDNDVPVSGQRDWRLTPSQPSDATLTTFAGVRVL